MLRQVSELPPVRDPRVPPPGSPAIVHQDELAAGRLRLDALRIHHLDLVRRFLEVADRSLYTIDVVMGAVMTRSYSLVDGFISAFDSWNPIVAAPLLRMQIDSLVRVAYIATAPRADEVAEYVLGGGEFPSSERRRWGAAEGQAAIGARGHGSSLVARGVRGNVGMGALLA